MFVAERGLTLCKSCNKSFLFGGSTRHNNPRKTEQPDVGTTSTSCKFEGRGRSESGRITSNLQFYFVDTHSRGVPEGLMPRCRVTLDFGPQKGSNPISKAYRVSDTFMARV
jgi:hypothetical protein